MKKLAILAAVAATFALPANAHGKQKRYVYQAGPIVITVSCFRGPLEAVIWDHPEGVFVDSLVAAGYDFPTAHAIAERICKDSRLVNNKELLRQTMREVYYASPAGRSN